MLFPLLVSAILPFAQDAPLKGISPGPPLAQVKIAREKDHLTITLGGDPFTTVHLSGRIPYLYPLLGPGGAPMTRGYPMDPGPLDSKDHPHHQSMWVAHGQINGVDFWHDPKAKILLSGEVRIIKDGPGARVHLPLSWIAPDGGVIMEEERILSFGGHARDRWVDVVCIWTAPKNAVSIGDTKEGTFAIRLNPVLRVAGKHAKGSLVNSEGLMGKQAWGKRARWVSSVGPVAGEDYTVTLFDHPSNPRSPTYWHARTYGLIAANPFGLHDFEKSPKGAGNMTIKAGASITFSHRVLLSRGRRTVGDLDRFQAGMLPPMKPEAISNGR